MFGQIKGKLEFFSVSIFIWLKKAGRKEKAMQIRERTKRKLQGKKRS